MQIIFIGQINFKIDVRASSDLMLGSDWCGATDTSTNPDNMVSFRLRPTDWLRSRHLCFQPPKDCMLLPCITLCSAMFVMKRRKDTFLSVLCKCVEEWKLSQIAAVITEERTPELNKGATRSFKSQNKDELEKKVGLKNPKDIGLDLL